MQLLEWHPSICTSYRHLQGITELFRATLPRSGSRGISSPGRSRTFPPGHSTNGVCCSAGGKILGRRLPAAKETHMAQMESYFTNLEKSLQISEYFPLLFTIWDNSARVFLFRSRWKNDQRNDCKLFFFWRFSGSGALLPTSSSTWMSQEVSKWLVNAL